MIFWFLCLCPYLSSYLYSHLSSRQREYQQGQGAPSWSPPSLNSKLSQFSTDPLPRSRTLPCSQNWIQIYTNGWRAVAAFICRRMENILNSHLKGQFLKLCFILLLFLVCIVVALPRVGDLTPQIAAGANTLLPPCHPSYSLGVAACICCVCLNLCPDVQAAFSSAPPKSSNQTSKI